jgi:hypothetical protein
VAFATANAALLDLMYSHKHESTAPEELTTRLIEGGPPARLCALTKTRDLSACRGKRRRAMPAPGRLLVLICHFPRAAWSGRGDGDDLRYEPVRIGMVADRDAAKSELRRVNSMRVIGFDHLVLNVSDVEWSLRFYGGTLGLAVEQGEEWRQGKAPFPSVRVSPTTIIDLVRRPRGGGNVDHICLVTEPLDWQEVIDSGVFTVLDSKSARVIP